MADNLPLALRRSRRSTYSLSGAVHASRTTLNDVPSPPLTPKSLRSSKSQSSRASKSSPTTASSKKSLRSRRVRFSDPGPLPSTPSTPSSRPCACSSPSSTGLTPFIRRASLHTGLPVSGEVNFLPLRQVLDGRVQRRLRRNGLSEEMNSLHAERRQISVLRRKTLDQELARLRAELATKDEQIQRLQVATPANDDADNDFMTITYDRECETEQAGVETPLQDQTYNWTMAAKDPFRSPTRHVGDDDGSMTEITEDMDGPLLLEADSDDVFGDTTMADLQCSTPVRSRQERRSHVETHDKGSQRTISISLGRGGGSFPSPPASSPPAWADNPRLGDDYVGNDNGLLLTPVTPKLHLFSTRQTSGEVGRSADMEVQVMLPDPESVRLHDEMKSLRQDQNTLQDRVATLVRDLADKTAALQGLSTSLQGFLPQQSETDGPLLDAADIVDHLGQAFRTARLELEYLTPGEIELPLSAPVVEVLDLLLAKLRQLAQQATAADAQLDEYHAIEVDLRKQLGARVTAMDELVAEVAAGHVRLESKELRIHELEIGADRFKGALASYARDVAELETVVQQLEVSLKEKEGQIGALAAAHAMHGPVLALCDARLQKLRGEMEKAHVAFRAAQLAAHTSTQRLRADNDQLEACLTAEKERTRAAKMAVAALQVLLETEDRQDREAAQGKKRRLSLGRRLFEQKGGSGHAVATAATELVTKTTTASTEDEQVAEEAPATPTRSTKKRRRYDSGLGFLDEVEEDAATGLYSHLSE
ncbi:hypothetical protein SEPCBS57363_006704 [Sporothrix epigloea]|uniref:Uncharacterized protein n=1 Tax=Sporothrix epigloea TaxID=1892477 RepID=A0ABP0E4F0_9PEZI